jgi:hypothetical protein
MATPSIQTLITQAQQVLNLKSSNEIRATLAAVLANANVGTPLNPNLTTQQLWDEFYEIVRQPSDDIMSIITDQMMRMVFSPPAPGGAGADKQVIFNDGGVLAGDTKFLWDKTANRLDVDGPVVITGDLTVRTNKLFVDATGVGINYATPAVALHLGTTSATNKFCINTAVTNAGDIQMRRGSFIGFSTASDNANSEYLFANGGALDFGINGSTAMTLNTSGNLAFANGKGIDFSATASGSGTMTSELLNDYEEGTFTPTVTSVGGTGIVYVASVSDSGRYTKIGRVVTFQVRLVGTYTGTFTYIRVALPFTATASNPNGVVSGYNNDTATALVGRTDDGAAWFIVSNIQPSGNNTYYSGFITS